jgi:hypothetical protein
MLTSNNLKKCFVLMQNSHNKFLHQLQKHASKFLKMTQTVFLNFNLIPIKKELCIFTSV